MPAEQALPYLQPNMDLQGNKSSIVAAIRLYASADVAFIGGSLVRHGGHNLVEALAVGVPTQISLDVATPESYTCCQ